MTLGARRAFFGIPLLWLGGGVGEDACPSGRADTNPDQCLWWVGGRCVFQPPKRRKKGVGGVWKMEKDAR